MNFYQDSGEYRATTQWPYAIAAGCVVYRRVNSGVEVLLLERLGGHPNGPSATKNTYNLPKGHVAIGEPLEATAQRETEEETGAQVLLQTYLGSITHDFIHPRFKMHNIKDTHYFAAVWQADTQTMDTEHDAKKWLPLADAEKLLADPEARRGEDEVIRRLRTYLELTRAA